MALAVLDRLLTIVVTATLTSAVWIVGGDAFIRGANGLSGVGTMGATAEARDASARDNASPMLEATAQTVLTAQEGRDLIIPVAGVDRSALVDTFAEARAGGARVHDAIDIMAPEGTPVVAAAPGQLEKMFFSEQGGKTLYVRSDDRRTIYYYAHLKDYDGNLVEGRKVQRGQRLGTVGYTGNADPAAPHLHFAIMNTKADAKWWEPATAINPYPLLTSR